MIVIIRYQDGTERAFPAHIGHNHHTGSFGCEIIDNGDGTWTWIPGNGYIAPNERAGGFFYSRIILRLDNDRRVDMLPRVAHYHANPSPGTTGQVEVGFGTGASYFPPGACKVLRFTVDGSSWARCYSRPRKVRKHPLLALPAALAFQATIYDAKAQRLLGALKTGKPSDDLKVLLGDWMPYGDPQSGAAGGDDINPYPGWEGSSAYAMLAMDLTTERNAIQYRDAVTGKPIRQANQETYRATGAWGKWTSHAEYVDVNPVLGGDYRVPHNLNTGTCPYVGALVGENRRNERGEWYWAPGYIRIDDQHADRYTNDAKVCALLYGDKAAAWLLDMHAADLFMGLDRTLVKEQGKGSGYGRGYAWTLSALNAANATGSDYVFERGVMVRAANRVQMANKLWYRAESQYEDQLGFAPSPWRDLGMPREYGVCQVMEACFLALAMFDAGETRGAVAAYLSLIEANSHAPLRKWIAVSRNGTPLAKLGESHRDTESFWLWPIAGLMGTAVDMEKLVPPGAGAVAGANVRASLLDAGNFNASAKALERLET